MLISMTQLIFMLLLIVSASLLFTNALEHIGHKAGYSSGVTGSIFAAIATALPETLVPIIAIVAGGANQAVNQDISVGAILGAPLMLSTLSTCLMALFVLKKRGMRGRIAPEKTGFVRDLDFFIMAFVLAAIAMHMPLQPGILRIAFSVLLVGIYAIYLRRTFKASRQQIKDGYGVVPDEPLILAKIGCKDNNRNRGLQLILGLILLLLGAKGFVHGVDVMSQLIGLSPLILALLIIPIATELPEKINSILWVRKHKDTLAFGNITGAMVFQGCLLPAIGVLLTPWQPSREVLISMGITLMAAIWLRVNATDQGVRISALMVSGVFYLVYLYLVI